MAAVWKTAVLEPPTFPVRARYLSALSVAGLRTPRPSIDFRTAACCTNDGYLFCWCRGSGARSWRIYARAFCPRLQEVLPRCMPGAQANLQARGLQTTVLSN